MIWRHLTNPPSSCSLCAAVGRRTEAVREILLAAPPSGYSSAWIPICEAHDPENTDRRSPVAAVILEQIRGAKLALDLAIAELENR